MGSDSALFFPNLSLALKKTEWVKAQRKLGTITLRKIKNSFWFIVNLTLLNDDTKFEKHCKDIYPTEFELKDKNDSSSCASFLIFTFTFKMENSILDYSTNKITFPLTS